jgi:3D (Asp-Asp-Asp) domain-containing protein
MKKVTVLLLLLFLMLSSYVFPHRSTGFTKVEKKTTKTTKKKKRSVKVHATYYNPVASQCDSNYLETASMDIIDLKKLKKKQIRWVACSRDQLKRWGGHLNYGDTITVVSKNKNVAGKWIVKDTMNKRYKKRIDFLCYSKIKGSLKDVVIKF